MDTEEYSRRAFCQYPNLIRERSPDPGATNGVVTCIQCNQRVSTTNYSSFTCTACKRGPFCERCSGNDIEHGYCDTPICESCVSQCHWCDNCEIFIALPDQPPPVPCKVCNKTRCDFCATYHDSTTGVCVDTYLTYDDDDDSSSSIEDIPGR